MNSILQLSDNREPFQKLFFPVRNTPTYKTVNKQLTLYGMGCNNYLPPLMTTVMQIIIMITGEGITVVYFPACMYFRFGFPAFS